MAFESTESFYKVSASVIQSGPHGRPTAYGDASPDSTLAAGGWYRLWVDDGGTQPSRFHVKQQGTVTVDVPGQRCTRADIWVDLPAADKRQRLESEIELQRSDADRRQIDTRADPGLVGLMDEANSEAERKRGELGSTDDGGLDAFDPTFDPRGADALVVAASLSRQERAILAAANPFTEQQRNDLAQAATQHEAIVDAGDPNATVPEVPSFARRMVGVIGEEYGMLFAHRVFINPWYWLEVRFEIDRDLDASNYFLAIYDENAPDDRDDTTANYLTTAQFVVTEPGKLIATRQAINLQRALDFGYKLTIAKGHLSQPQFDRVLFAGGLLFDEYRVRWGGLA